MTDKPLILGTGLSGLIGTRIQELLSDYYDFESVGLTSGVDIVNTKQITDIIVKSPAKIILHIAAKADVDGCERDKALGTAGDAWKINVGGTANIVEAASATNKKIIYISTDFVFAGTKEEYTEEDVPNPVNWYGVTKFEGEKLVLKNSQNLVVRIAYPYRAKNQTKKDFLHAFFQKFEAGEKVVALTDHYVTPTFIDDIAIALGYLINANASGTYHVVGSQTLTPFQVAHEIAHAFNFSKGLILPAQAADFYTNRAPRPYKLRVNNAKISALGVDMRSLSDGLLVVKAQGII